MAAYGPPCAVEYQPLGMLGNPDPRPSPPRQNLVVAAPVAAGPTTTTTTSFKTSSSYIAVLLAGISLLTGTVVHVVAFSLPYWFTRDGHEHGGMGLWNIESCGRGQDIQEECRTFPITSFVGLDSWFLAVRAMETIGVIVSILACGLFIILLIRRGPLSQATLDRRNREMEHNPLCGLSAFGRICLICFTALLLLAGLSIIIGLVIIFCNLEDTSPGVNYAVVLSGFSGFTFLIGGTLAAAGMCEIIFKAK